MSKLLTIGILSILFVAFAFDSLPISYIYLNNKLVKEIVRHNYPEEIIELKNLQNTDTLQVKYWIDTPSSKKEVKFKLKSKNSKKSIISNGVLDNQFFVKISGADLLTNASWEYSYSSDDFKHEYILFFISVSNYFR